MCGYLFSWCAISFLSVRLHFRLWFGWRRDWMLMFLTLVPVPGLLALFLPELPVSIWRRGCSGIRIWALVLA
jgi:hypothetical protein